jgi:hypothetical protein
MRVWDIGPGRLCRNHLLGEHRELHAIWTILTEGRKGYSRHPETLRWQGKLLALYGRHERLASEMKRRGYDHRSPLDRKLAKGGGRQTAYVHTPRQQEDILRRKGCGCRV